MSFTSATQKTHSERMETLLSIMNLPYRPKVFHLALAICGIFCGGMRVSYAQESGPVHTPREGTSERKAILATLHSEYTTGSGSAVKFKVNFFKVHDGWAWINVVPLNKSGEPEGEEWPSLLHYQAGTWSIIDLIKISAAIDDPVGPVDPTPAFLREVKRRNAGVPSDIFPPARKD